MSCDQGDFRLDAGGNRGFFGQPEGKGLKNRAFRNRITMIDRGNVVEDVAGFHTRV
jgi:hypothetical protein